VAVQIVQEALEVPVVVVQAVHQLQLLVLQLAQQIPEAAAVAAVTVSMVKLAVQAL